MQPTQAPFAHEGAREMQPTQAPFAHEGAREMQPTQAPFAHEGGKGNAANSSPLRARRGCRPQAVGVVSQGKRDKQKEQYATV